MRGSDCRPSLRNQSCVNASACSGAPSASAMNVSSTYRQKYARGEAAALTNDRPDVAMAIADGLIGHGLLSGAQVDEIMARTFLRRPHAMRKSVDSNGARWRRRVVRSTDASDKAVGRVLF